ncbi:MAG: hypothetical protein AB7F96_19070 [Beijerinckiaceae bacterium]
MGERDKDPENTTSARDAALYDPDSVYHDQTTAGRALSSLAAKEPAEKPEEPSPEETPSPYARAERRRTGALTPEMIKRIADRAEKAAGRKG